MNLRRTLLAVVAIPLTSATGWQDLKFKKIPPNLTTFSADGLQIRVNKSSSPLIYPLPNAVDVTGFRAEIEIEGEIKAQSGFPEDAYLRLGFVAPGSRKLNAMERWMAADWLKKLFSLAPKDGGVDKVYFFNLADHASGEAREFPGSKGLMTEKIIAVRSKETKKVELKQTLPQSIKTLALWLSVDGDNSESSYVLNMKSLNLETKPQGLGKSE